MFLATHAVAYQAGLRYGTFNQLEFVSQNVLKNELDFNLQKELNVTRSDLINV